MVRDYLALALSAVDMEFVKKHSMALHQLEKFTSYRDFPAVTDYLMGVMREAGFSAIERIALPSDGVTTYDDCTMPEAWSRTGRSTLAEVDAAGHETAMLADSDVEPISAVIWSIPTPPGGTVAELVSYQATPPGHEERFKGKIVLCPTSPNGALLRRILAGGAVGMVSYIAENVELEPDSVRWMNGVGHTGWYFLKGEPRLWNFSITPRKAAALEARLAAGERITLRAVMNTEVYDGEIYTVTGRIPGRSSRELALIAHLYEPFIADDSAGAILSIAVGKALRELSQAGRIPPLEKSIRVVFSMERYGFSAFFHDRDRAGKIIAAMNMDSICHATLKLAGIPLELRRSPASSPFFFNTIIREYLRSDFPEVKFRETPGNLSDDTFGAEPPFDIPTGWLHTPAAKFRHHNTAEIFAGVDWEIARCVASVMTALYAECAVVRRGSGDRRLARRVLEGVRKDAVAEFRRLSGEVTSGRLDAADAAIIGGMLAEYCTGRVAALNKLVRGMADTAAARRIFRTMLTRRAWYRRTSLKVLDETETVMRRMIVTRPPEIRQIMSLGKVPSAERFALTTKPEMLLQALLDGKRDLYSAYIFSNFMLRRTPADGEAEKLVAFFRALSKYGYYTIAERAEA